jgi:hypothetical protein
METPKWSESEFARSTLSDLGLLDPTNRLNKPELAEIIVPKLIKEHCLTELSQALLASVGIAKSQCPELLLDVSPKYWRTDEDGGSEGEREGMNALSELVWGEISASGTVQHRLTGRYLLCRGRVERNVQNPVGAPSPVKIQVAFVTDNADVANVHYITPATGSLVRKAESLTKQLDLAIERMPENAENIAILLSPAVQEAVNKLSQITQRAGLKLTVTTEGKLALTSGSTKKAS